MDTEKLAKDRADWLLDAVAMSTQDRRFLRGDPQYVEAFGEAVLLNGEKAIRVAVEKMARKIESIQAVVCLADDLLMATMGAFPLPGNPLRDDCIIVRSVSGEDYAERKKLAAIARQAGPLA